MERPSPTHPDELISAVSNIRLSESGPSSIPIDQVNSSLEAGANPWNETPGHSKLSANPPPGEQEHHLKTPDPSMYDPAVIGGLGTDLPSEPIHHKIDEDVLNEFDPLANSEQKAAQEAWQTAESHPPPRPHTPDAPPPPEKDTQQPSTPQPPSTPTPTTSSFPSITAFARTFSIPVLSKARPLSLEGAKNVPSPATLSSFATQQQQAPIPPAGESSNIQASTSHSNDSSSPSSDRDKGDQPFDFQRFLDQMKTKSAEPIAKYLKSFLSSFTKRTFTVSDQVKIISDFLNFIAGKMREVDIWRNASDAEFDNALEGIEKLVMNRLYEFTFTPAVVAVVPPRPITTDDLERDRVLSQRVALFGWLEEKHLDIPVGEGSKGFLMFAQQELMKINHYKAPRDKLICILNCCKVIFGLIRHLKKEEGADSFVPLLIFVVLKANPDHLLSNVEQVLSSEEEHLGLMLSHLRFINRFRNPSKLQSEAGYYLSSLMGAVSFIETMDHTSLSNITQEEFEKNVEDAIQSLPRSHPGSNPHSPIISGREPSTPRRSSSLANSNIVATPHAGEESAEPLALPTPAQSLSDDARRLLQKTGDTISKPLNAIGRIFSEALDGAEGKLSYLPGPFGPMEVGRDARQANENGQGQGRPPYAPWAYPGERQQYLNQTNSAPASPGPVPYTPLQAGEQQPPIQTPYKPRVRRVPSPSYLQQTPGSPGYGPEDTPSRPGPYHGSSQSLSSLSSPLRPLIPASTSSPLSASLMPGSTHVSRTPTPNLDFAGMQSEIDHAHEQASQASRETLVQIFPGVDSEVIEWVLEAKEGDLGKSIEALLELSGGD